MSESAREWNEEILRGMGIHKITEPPQDTILRLRHENLDLEHRISYLTEQAIRIVDLCDQANTGSVLVNAGACARSLYAAINELRELLVKFGTPPTLPGRGGTMP